MKFDGLAVKGGLMLDERKRRIISAVGSHGENAKSKRDNSKFRKL